MSNELRPQNVKEYKKVEVRLLVPYAIIAIMLFTIGGLITGWTVRNIQTAQFEREVAERVSLKESQ